MCGRENEIRPYLRKAHFHETDQMGIIHHANYIRWMEEARLDFMDQVGYSYRRAEELGIDIVLTRLNCRYKSMVRYGDVIKVDIIIKELTPLLFTIAYVMSDEVTGEVRCTGETQHLCYDREKKRPARMSRSLPELYELLGAVRANEG